MEFTINNNMISKGTLGGAVSLVPAAAFANLTGGPPSEFWLYIFVGTFLLFVFLHLFFRDESFDKLQAINHTVWILLGWLTSLVLFAFMLGAYVTMFVSLGFLIVIYLIHLLISVLKLEKRMQDKV